MAVAVTLEVALLPQTVLEDVISDFAAAVERTARLRCRTCNSDTTKLKDYTRNTI